MFQAPAIVTKLETMADHGVKLIAHTRELSPDEMAKLFELRGKEGWLLLKENPIKDEDVPLDVAPTLRQNRKSKCQELRNALYKLYLQTEQTQDFDTDFYPMQMDRLIQRVLEVAND